MKVWALGLLPFTCFHMEIEVTIYRISNHLAVLSAEQRATTWQDMPSHQITTLHDITALDLKVSGVDALPKGLFCSDLCLCPLTLIMTIPESPRPPQINQPVESSGSNC